MLVEFFFSGLLGLTGSLFSVFPSVISVATEFASGLNIVLSWALAWEFIVPIKEMIALVPVAVIFQITLIPFMIVKWLIERV